MNNLKKHCTKKEMIEILSERNIEIDQPDVLDKVNYSHLIYNFGKHYLVDEKKLIYKKDTKISHIYNLYLLNIEISSILFIFLNKFEHKLKLVLASIITKPNSIAYLNEDFYNLKENEKGKTEIKQFISNVNKTHKKIINKLQKDFLIDGKVPFWILVDELALGQLRMIIKFSIFKKEIFKEMRITIKNSWKLEMINVWRNRIMHMNPLSKTIKHNDKEFKLKNFIDFINYWDKDSFCSIKKLLKTYDFSKININLKNLLGIFGLNQYLKIFDL